MTCGVCGQDSTPATTVRGLTICPHCLATVHASGMRATAADTVSLGTDELKALRDLRKAHRAAQVPAP